MSAILKREIKNYLKRPLYWIGILIVVLGVYQNLSPYLGIHYLEQGEAIENEYPDTVREGEVYEGYVPSSEEKQRADWEKRKKSRNIMQQMKNCFRHSSESKFAVLFDEIFNILHLLVNGCYGTCTVI